MRVPHLRLVLAFVGIIGVVSAWGQEAGEAWLGLYLQGKKAGYSSVISKEGELGGKKVWVREGQTVFDGSMLGQDLKITAKTKSFLNQTGKLLRLEYVMDSSGRTLNVEADFGDDAIVARMTAGGELTEKRIEIPEGAKIVDDPVNDLIMGENMVPKTERVVYVFSAEALELIKTPVKVMEKTQIDGVEGDVIPVLVEDPRAATTIYYSGKGDFIKAVGPLGLELRPESKAEAMNMTGEKADLAVASTIVLDRVVDLNAKSATYLVTGASLLRAPVGGHQEITQDEKGYTVVVNPVEPAELSVLISQAKLQKKDWVGPDVRVPSDDAAFVELAKSVVGEEERVYPAAQKLRRYVNRIMGVDAGIGVMRGAKEIYETKTGVCRDHAILLGTLLRSVDIPTRFVNGLVSLDGKNFLYHAWVEVWDGRNWVGLDSTRPQDTLTVSHIKTSQGTVGEALTGFLLDGAKIKLLDQGGVLVGGRN